LKNNDDNHWTYPKAFIDEDSPTLIDPALKSFQEKTNINLEEDKFWNELSNNSPKDDSHFRPVKKYIIGKNKLFVYFIDDKNGLIRNDTSLNLKCNTITQGAYLKWKNGSPEYDKFMWVTRREAEKMALVSQKFLYEEGYIESLLHPDALFTPTKKITSKKPNKDDSGDEAPPVSKPKEKKLKADSKPEVSAIPKQKEAISKPKDIVKPKEDIAKDVESIISVMQTLESTSADSTPKQTPAVESKPEQVSIDSKPKEEVVLKEEKPKEEAQVPLDSKTNESAAPTASASATVESRPPQEISANSTDSSVDSKPKIEQIPADSKPKEEEIQSEKPKEQTPERS